MCFKNLRHQCQNINVHYCDPQVHVGFKCRTESPYCQDTRKVHITFKKKIIKGIFQFWPLTSSPEDCKLYMQDKIFLTLHCLSWSCLKAKFSAKLIQIFWQGYSMTEHAFISPAVSFDWWSAYVTGEVNQHGKAP